MNKKYILIFLLSLAFFQEQIGEGLHSENLIDYLKMNYTTSNVLSYSAARDILYSEIDNIDGSVYGIYTNYSVELDESIDPSVHLYENGMDCEHIWPQSMYNGTSPMKSDMHHLRPSKSNVNNNRGNKPFKEIPDFQTDTWFWLTNQLSNIPSNNIDEYSESNSNYFEPREDVKGNIARSMFYFYTIYSDVANQDFFDLQKNDIYEWHILDPIEENDINRTFLIAEYQNDIPNPFILDNSLIYRAYFYNNITGDLNLDGIVNVVDIILIVNFIMETGTFTDNQFLLADSNADGIINVVDIILLMNIILGV